MTRCSITCSLLALSGFICGIAADDVVLLTNGQRLVGTLDSSVEAKPGTVAIRTRHGLLRLRSDLVARVEESYETRLAKVANDDSAGLLALAKWCLSRDMETEARELLSRALKTTAVPVEARGLHAQLVDKVDGAEAALPLYRAYRDAKGSDSIILARLKTLEDVELKARTAANEPVASAQAPVGTEGLETRGWDSESPQWSNAVTATLVNLGTERGRNQAISLSFTGGDKDKVAVKRPLRNIQLGDNRELALYACNRSKAPLRLSLALKTGNYIFHESQTLVVPADGTWHEVRIDLRSQDWKCEASKWAYSSAVAQLDDLKEMQILIYNGKADGTLLLDGIAFAPAKAKEAQAESPVEK